MAVEPTSSVYHLGVLLAVTVTGGNAPTRYVTERADQVQWVVIMEGKAMGTDIHLMIEYKTERGWFPAGSPNEEIQVWRDYKVFNTLVGTVRAGYASVSIASSPRGLPADIQLYTREIIEVTNYHSASWISEQEFMFHFPWRDEPNLMSHFAIVGWSYIQGRLRPIRFVFAFDN